MGPSNHRPPHRRTDHGWAFRGAVLIALGLGVNRPAGAGLLYDVNFEAPKHQVSQPVTIGRGATPRSTASELAFGATMIEAPPGILDGQYASFRKPTTGSSYVQMIFGFDPHVAILDTHLGYRVQADVFVQSLTSGQFSLFADTPNSHSVRLTPSGEVYSAVWGAGEEPTLTMVGYYRQGERLTVDVTVNQAAERWAVQLNGRQIWEGPYPIDDTDNPLRQFRFALMGSSSTDFVAVDNVRVWGLPEPSTAVLLAFGVLQLARRRR